MPTLLDEALVTDTLNSLPGWQAGDGCLWREVHLPPEQDTELRRQVEVDAAAMGHQPTVESVDGGTRFTLRTPEAGGVTELDVAFAAHLSDLAHRIAGSEPGVDAVREGDPVVVVRPGESALGEDATPSGTEDDGPTVGVASVTGGGAPRVPLPDEDPYAPEPGPKTEQEPLRS